MLRAKLDQALREIFRPRFALTLGKEEGDWIPGPQKMSRDDHQLALLFGSLKQSTQGGLLADSDPKEQGEEQSG